MTTSLLTFEPWLEHSTYEVFPSPNIEQKVASQLPHGSRVAVTHSPKQGIGRSVQIAESLSASGYEVVLHIGARGLSSRTELGEVVDRAVAAGVSEAFVVGGDGTPVGSYVTATQVMVALDQMGRPFARVGIAGHPEGHPHANANQLMLALAEKQALGASYIATQMCFESEPWLAWSTSLIRAGIMLPISVGVPGVVSRRKLLEIGVRAGAGTSLRALKGQRGFARRALTGQDYAPDELLLDLSGQSGSSRISGVHLFTFNALEATSEWVARRLALLA